MTRWRCAGSDSDIWVCEANGAEIVCVGDRYQPSAMRDGGSFSLSARGLGADAPRLNRIHKFTETWEAEISRLLSSALGT